MTKTDIVNDIIYSISDLNLSKNQLEIIKLTMIAKLADYELTDVRKLPSIDNTNNEELMKRFMIDALTRGLHKSTIKQYIRCVQRLFDFSGKDFRQITGQDVMDWIYVEHYKKGLSQTHRSNLCTWCRAFFNWAYKRHFIETDVSRDIETIRPKQKKKDRIFDEEIEKIRNGLIDSREKALFELMICTGMRVGEISNLKIHNVNFEKKIINVYAEKTDTYRDLFLTNRCVLALEEYIKDRDKNEYLFKPKYKKGRLSSKSIEKIAIEMGKRVNCHLKTTVHVYRKTLGTLLSLKTGDMYLAQSTLGHSSIAITEKYYHVEDKESMKFKYNMLMN